MTTLQVTRLGNGRPGSAIDLVYSPDDGGYYLSHQDFVNVKSRVSTKIYSTAEAAKAEWNVGEVDWEDWH